MYSRTYWYDEVVEHPYRYIETDNGDGTIEHVAAPGETLQEGTPLNAANLNNLETGVEDGQIATSIFLQFLRNYMEVMQEEVDKCKEVKITVPAFSSLPQTFTSAQIADISKITADHRLHENGAVLSVASAQGSDWTVTTGNGSITIDGTFTGENATTVTMDFYLPQ